MRFVEQAIVLQGNAHHQADWRAWTRFSETELPPHIAQIALQALSGMALHVEELIIDDRTEPAEAARLENDLGYIADIESALTEFLYEPTRAYN
jgi:hypothetical protein